MSKVHVRLGCIATGFAIALLVTGQSPAHAATQTFLYTCLDTTPVTIDAQPGDTLGFESDCGPAPGASGVDRTLFASAPADFSSTWPQVFVISPTLAPSTYQNAFEMVSASHQVYALRIFAQSGGIPDWHKSYGRPQNSECQTGWNPSWANWPNAGTGGYVCNQTLTWNGSSWTVR